MKLKILHLEDNAIDSELVAADLEEGEIFAEICRVETRASFTEALKNDSFDLILADYSLPSFDGLSALLIARELVPNTPFIIFSGAVGEEIAVEMLKSGATDYIFKHRLERFLPSVRRALREAEERRKTKIAELKRFEAEKRFEMLSSVATEIIWDINYVSGSVWTSESIYKVTGFRQDEIGGNEWWRKMIHEQDSERVFDDFLKSLKNLSKDWNDQFRLRCKDGSYIHVLSRAFIVYDENGAPLRMVGSMSDITSRIVAEEERQKLLESEREARQRSEEANRLKDEFLATVSHELRTPLNAILGWATMLRRNELNEEEQRRAVEVIEQSARAQNRIIEDILDVSRIITGKLQLNPQPLNIGQAVRAVVDSVCPAAVPKSITIEVDIPENIGTIDADASRIQQIIWNILSNAVKFTPVGGKVFISAEDDGKCVEIKVRDTGKGIAPDFLPFVFDRFRQAESPTTRHYGGLGLGLSIVKNLVEMHGGTVSVTSEGVGKGAVFGISLPRQGESCTDKPKTETKEIKEECTTLSNTLPSLEGLRILAVDDDAASLEILKLMLMHFSADVATAQSVAEAVEQLETNCFDALVSDVGMPDEDGYSLARRLRRMPETQNGAIAAIALTGFARDDDRRTALDAGFNAHLSKPYNFEELNQLLLNLTSGKLETVGGS